MILVYGFAFYLVYLSYANDYFKIANSGSRDFLIWDTPERKPVVESVRFQIDGALHDPKRLLSVVGFDGRAEGDAGGGACLGPVVESVACLGTWAVDEVLSRIVRIKLFDCGLREGGPDSDLVRS